MQHRRSPFALAVVLAALGLGCGANVKVIRPVADVNRRNAEALEANVRAAVGLLDRLLPAVLEIQVVDAHRDVQLAIAEATINLTDAASARSHFTARSQKLRADVAALDADLRPVQIEQLRRVEPLAAEIAFGDLTVGRAVATWQAFDNNLKLKVAGTPPADIFRMQRTVLAGLTPLRRAERARRDVLEAWGRARKLLLRQTEVSREIADQLAQASRASADPAAFLQGTLENPEVMGAVRDVIAGTVTDPERRARAEALLNAIENPESILETLNLTQ